MQEIYELYLFGGPRLKIIIFDNIFVFLTLSCYVLVDSIRGHLGSGPQTREKPSWLPVMETRKPRWKESTRFSKLNKKMSGAHGTRTGSTSHWYPPTERERERERENLGSLSGMFKKKKLLLILVFLIPTTTTKKHCPSTKVVVFIGAAKYRGRSLDQAFFLFYFF